MAATSTEMPGLVEHELQLVGAVRRVDVDQDDADLRRGVLDERPLGDVRRPDADPVALGQPRREQPERHRVDVVAQLAVGPPPAGRHLHQRLGVGLRGGHPVEVVADRVAEQRHVGRAGGVGRDGGGSGGHDGGASSDGDGGAGAHASSAGRLPVATSGWGGAPESRGDDRATTPGPMHDPRVLLDPATDAVRKLARRGFALDVASLEKLLCRAQRRHPARRRGAGRVQAGRHRGEGRRRRRAAGARRARPRAQGASSPPPSRSTAQLEAELQELLLGIPNLPSDELPDGASDADAEQVRSWGEPADARLHPARPRRPRRAARASSTSPRATKLSGPAVRGAARARRGAGARAGRYFLDLHTERHGYTEFSVPTLVNRADDDRHRAAAEVRAGPVPAPRWPTASCSSSPPPRCR